MVTQTLGKVSVTSGGEWNASQAYEALTIVTANGNGYMSKKAVPIGTAISNTEYWGLIVSKGDDGASNWNDISGKPSTFPPSTHNHDDRYYTEEEVQVIIGAITALIPSQASAINQLADKSFVNSSIATNTANYISNNGEPFTSLAQLQAYTGTVTHNDYAFVTGTDEQGNSFYDRYKASVNGSTVTWAKEYRLNNSSFTAVQWAAIQSGITAALVQKLQNIDTDVIYTSYNITSLTTMGELRTAINTINTNGEHAMFDCHSYISGAYVCLITMTETTTDNVTTYYCEINDLLNHRTYSTYTGYALTDTITAFITSATVKGDYRSISLPNTVTCANVVDVINKINSRGEHIIFDLSSMVSGAYLCTIVVTVQGSVYTFKVYDIMHGAVYSFAVLSTYLSTTLAQYLSVASEMYNKAEYAKQPKIYDSSFFSYYNLSYYGGNRVSNRIFELGSRSSLTLDLPTTEVLPTDETIVRFTATANFTVSITGTCYGDTVINAVSGKTYEIAFTGNTSTSWVVSYRGW